MHPSEELRYIKQTYKPCVLHLATQHSAILSAHVCLSQGPLYLIATGYPQLPDCVQSIGEDKESVESSSATITESEQGFMPVYFEPRPLKNLQIVDELESLCPITDMKVQAEICSSMLMHRAHTFCQIAVSSSCTIVICLLNCS